MLSNAPLCSIMLTKIFFYNYTLHSQCPDHQIHHSLTPYDYSTSATIDRETAWDQDAQPWPRRPWSPDSTTWRGELIIHCICALRWPKVAPYYAFPAKINAHYASIILASWQYLLFPKLCQHNLPRPGGKVIFQILSRRF